MSHLIGKLWFIIGKRFFILKTWSSKKVKQQKLTSEEVLILNERSCLHHHNSVNEAQSVKKVVDKTSTSNFLLAKDNANVISVKLKRIVVVDFPESNVTPIVAITKHANFHIHLLDNSIGP
jgi:hypothetical protein